jgi:hypothetical protein
MLFSNKTEECKPFWGLRHRQLDLIDTVMVHRIWAEGITSVPELAQWFIKHPETGIPSMPYTFIVFPDGVVEQALPLSIVAPHGRKWNTRAVGVGFFGDFTKYAPTAEQLLGGQELVALLAQAFTIKPSIVGHTYVPDSTSDTGKDCPGKHFPLSSFVDGIEYGLRSEGIHRLKQTGVVF